MYRKDYIMKKDTDGIVMKEDSDQIIIPMEDDLVHTHEQPFCSDRHCPCHWDMSPDSLDYRQAYVWQYIDLGFLTYLEADRILEGYAL
jgi:hypothetical protein